MRSLKARRGTSGTEDVVAGLCHLRGGLVRALLVATACFVATPVSSADPAPPLAHRALAARQAAAQGRLLLFIDLGGDFLVDPATAPEAKFYRSLAMSDPAVAELIASRFVVSFRHVGQSKALERTSVPKGERQPSTSDFAIAYVCLPNLRVLDFIPGLVSSNVMLRELSWADACNRDRLRTSPDMQERFVRDRHLTAALPAERNAFHAHRTSRWRDGLEAPMAPAHQDLVTVLRAAAAARDQTLKERLKSNWPSEADQRNVLTALAAHGELQPALAHLVLAEYPLPKLADIERPLYEIAMGQRFWQEPPDRESVLAWWSDVRLRGAPSLLIVHDDSFYAPEMTEAEPIVWPPPPIFKLRPNLRLLMSRAVTLDELAVLVAGAGLEPIRFAAAQSPPRYVIHDALGFRLAQLSAREGTNQRLSQALRAISNSGELAAATGTGGVTTDDDN
jgi:hypothetical protein